MELTPNSLRALLAHSDRQAVADACGVDRTTVSRWANGRLTPHVRYLPNIGAALGVAFCITLGDAADADTRRAFRTASLETERHAAGGPRP
jgi:transcriptional regulator with XRE-family HTH domain